MKRFYEKSLKGTILLSLLVLFSMTNYAATYYVSNTGNDSNSGLSSSAPWQTLGKVNSANFMPGDQVLFQKGNTFYGSLTVKNSGRSGSPITLGAYGSGANPVITGFTSVSSWTNLGNNIWESTSSVSTLANCNMVVVNGVDVAMGRYPNADTSNGGYFVMNSVTSTNFTSGQLTGSLNWTGAEVVYRQNSYWINRQKITSHSGNTITPLINGGERLPSGSGNGFFIQNDARTLDQQNEWYYNPLTRKLRIYSSSQPTNVKMATVEKLLIINESLSYININGIDFVGSHSNALYRNPYSSESQRIHHIGVTNCNLSFTGDISIALRGHFITIENNTITNTYGDGILSDNNRHMIIRNNVIQNVGRFPGMAYSSGANCGISIAKTTDCILEYNTIKNVRYNGVNASSAVDSVIIRSNYIDNFCTLLDDGAAIYTVALGKAKIIGNVILNGNTPLYGLPSNSGQAVGIYLDDNTRYTEVLNNSISNCSHSGLYLHNASYNVVTGNTIYNSGLQQVLVKDDSNAGTSENNTISNNIFVAKTASQYPAQYRFPSTYYSMGTVNYNYYLRPIAETNTIRVIVGSTITNYTLSGWQSYSKHDLNSNKSPQTISSESDLQFEYNATKTTKTVSLSRPMIDAKGTKYSGSITLQPFTSVVLIKDASPTAASVPGAPTSVVATAGDARATVTFAAPTNNGGSAITGYTVTSLPAGGTDLNAGSTSLTHTISGLTNGTSYTFTVKATNSVGTSVASAPSNSVVPKSAVTVASTFTFTGPSSGNVNSASSSFTVTPSNAYTGTITITPSGTGSAGLSSEVLTFSNSSTAQTFTITPTVAGSIALTATNNGGLTNPGNLNFTVNAVAPGAPTSVVANAGNSSATVTFAAPTNNGGSAITGYTVTSLPAGGTDLNAGSTSLTHSISGLTNGTSYTFTVKATNSGGTSLASTASNSVVPSAPVSVVNNYTLTGPTSGNVNSAATFIIDPSNVYTGSITITPTGTGSVGLSAKVLTFVESHASQSFTFTPTVAGSITFTATNNGGLTNPASLNFTVNALVPVSVKDIAPPVISSFSIPPYGSSLMVPIFTFTASDNIGVSGYLITESASAPSPGSNGWSTWVPTVYVFSSPGSKTLYAWVKDEAGNVSASRSDQVRVSKTNLKNGNNLKSGQAEDMLSEQMEEQIGQIDVFPNPTMGRITVRFSTQPVEGSRIEILDLSGRMIASRIITGMSEEFNLDQQAPGVYLVKLMIGSAQRTHKLIITK